MGVSSVNSRYNIEIVIARTTFYKNCKVRSILPTSMPKEYYDRKDVRKKTKWTRHPDQADLFKRPYVIELLKRIKAEEERNGRVQYDGKQKRYPWWVFAVQKSKCSHAKNCNICGIEIRPRDHRRSRVLENVRIYGCKPCTDPQNDPDTMAAWYQAKLVECMPYAVGNCSICHRPIRRGGMMKTRIEGKQRWWACEGCATRPGGREE